MTKIITFETPLSNFRRIIEQDLSDKFILSLNIIGDENTKDIIKYQITQNEARIISKKINDLFKIDPTIEEYEFELKKEYHQEISNNLGEDIKDVLKLINKSAHENVEIPQDKSKLFYIIRFLLGETQQIEIENEDEAISLLNTEYNASSIKYLCDNLLKVISNGKAKQLNEQIIIDLIDFYFEQRQQLKNKEMNKNEDVKDEIVDIFNQMKKHDETSHIIMHFIIQALMCEEVMSGDMIEFFYENLDDEMIEIELDRIVVILKNHLITIKEKLNKSKESIKDKRKIECNFTGDELSGIISYLKRKNGEDLTKLGILSMSGGYPNASYPITNLIKYDQNHINDYFYNNSYKCPSSESDSWIEFDFVNRKVNLTSYTIRTSENDSNHYWNPKSWRIAGSNDRNEWDTIDHQENQSQLNGRVKQHRFECSKSDKYYRYIRYIQEDSWNSSISKYTFRLSCVEFFGSVVESDL